MSFPNCDLLITTLSFSVRSALKQVKSTYKTSVSRNTVVAFATFQIISHHSDRKAGAESKEVKTNTEGRGLCARSLPDVSTLLRSLAPRVRLCSSASIFFSIAPVRRSPACPSHSRRVVASVLSIGDARQRRAAWSGAQSQTEIRSTLLRLAIQHADALSKPCLRRPLTDHLASRYQLILRFFAVFVAHRLS
jgi:hypothetical protein